MDVDGIPQEIWDIARELTEDVIKRGNTKDSWKLIVSAILRAKKESYSEGYSDALSNSQDALDKVLT